MSLYQPEVIHLDVPARSIYLHILSDCIADMLHLVEGADGADGTKDVEMLTYNVQLATHEVCTNIITHAYKGKQSSESRIDVVLALHWEPLHLEIKLRDNGCAFDPALIPAPNLQETQIHGYGLFLIHSLMDTVIYTSPAGSNYWRLIKHL